jgi:tetratricopeptide (TPR) repeat protein
MVVPCPVDPEGAAAAFRGSGRSPRRRGDSRSSTTDSPHSRTKDLADRLARLKNKRSNQLQQYVQKGGGSKGSKRDAASKASSAAGVDGNRKNNVLLVESKQLQQQQQQQRQVSNQKPKPEIVEARDAPDAVDTHASLFVPQQQQVQREEPVQQPEQKQEASWLDYFFQAPGNSEPKATDSKSERDPPESVASLREKAGTNEQQAAATQQPTSAIFNEWLSWLEPISPFPPASTLTTTKQQQPQQQSSSNSTPLTKARSSAPTPEAASSSSKSLLRQAAAPHRTSSTPNATHQAKRTIDLAAQDDDDGDKGQGDADSASVESELDGPSKLFSDLESLPSAKGDAMTTDGSVKTADLDIRDESAASVAANNENMASVVEAKVKNIKYPVTHPSIETDGNGNKTDVRDQSMEARRRLLVRELKTAMDNFGRYDVHVANISAALGDLLDESKKHEQAIKLHRDAVEIYSSKLGDDHSTTMDAKLQLGNVLENAGEYNEAINIYFLITVMRRAMRGEKDPSAADALVRMAQALRKKGEYHLAIKELKRALKIYRESLGDAHEKVSATVDEIASLYVTLGDFEKSAAILEEVVKLKAATQGMKSHAVAMTLTSLATTYECSEDFTKAMKSLKKAYKIYTEVDGYSSKESTITLNRIAQLYEAIGDSSRASIAYLGVLRGRKINYGDDHLLVGETYYKLGHTLRESGQLEKALKCAKEALPIFVGKGVEMHDVEMIAEVLHEMALIHKEKKRYGEATRIFKQELGVRRRIGQPDFPLVARTLNHLGITEYALKNNSKALKYLIEALTIFKDGGEKSIDCAEVLFNTGLVFESSRNRERAMEAYDEAARIFREHGYSETHPHLVKAMRKIEKLQAQQRK